MIAGSPRSETRDMHFCKERKDAYCVKIQGNIQSPALKGASIYLLSFSLRKKSASFEMLFRKLFNRVEDIFTERNDPLIWSRELERHFSGSYSYACVRARPGPQLEFRHVELGSRATLVGIYDGHNSLEMALHAYENLFDLLIDNILRKLIIDEEKVTQVVDVMENQIIALSREDITQKFATVGSCCLIV
ncbi:hypothetical protein HN51_041397 [Arachis hypogaea]